mgnify:FL=1
MAVKVIVHEFALGDVDDSDIYAAMPIYEWQQSEVGKWVAEHSTDIQCIQQCDHFNFQQKYRIVAVLSDQDATWFRLKYDNAKA